MFPNLGSFFAYHKRASVKMRTKTERTGEHFSVFSINQTTDVYGATTEDEDALVRNTSMPVLSLLLLVDNFINHHNEFNHHPFPTTFFSF